MYCFNLALDKIDLGAPNRREISIFQGFFFRWNLEKLPGVSVLIGNKIFSEVANVKI